MIGEVSSIWKPRKVDGNRNILQMTEHRQRSRKASSIRGIWQQREETQLYSGTWSCPVPEELGYQAGIKVGIKRRSQLAPASGSQASSISITQALVRNANSHAHCSPTELETPSNLCLNRPSVILTRTHAWEPLASWLSTGTLEPECQSLNPSSASN